MCKLVLSVIPFNIHSEVQPIKIGDPEGISVAVHYHIRIVKSKRANRVGYRTACLVYEIRRNTITPCKPVVRNQADIVWLVEIGREKFTVIYPFLRKNPIKSV